MSKLPVLIIIGTAPQMVSDLGRIPDSLHAVSHHMAINEAGILYTGRIEYWTSFHPEYFRKPDDLFGYKHWLEWEADRAAAEGNSDYIRFSHIKLNGNVDCLCPYRMKVGSSSLLGVEAGLDMGYTKIITCGVDLLTERYAKYQKGWIDNREELSMYVRAYSGLPFQLFGEPTQEWMEG